MRLSIFILTIGWFLFPIASCAEQDDLNCSVNRKDRLCFVGMITTDSVDRFIRKATDENKYSVVLTSQGGESIPAIRLSKFLMEHDFDVRFEDYCLSSCAHFLFLALSGAQYSEDLVVAFHHTQSSFERVRELAGIRTNHYVTNSAAAERQFYTELGLPLEFLISPMINTEPKLIGFDERFIGYDLRAQAYSYRYNNVVPPANEIQALNSRIDLSFWPKNEEELKVRIVSTELQNVVHYVDQWANAHTDPTRINVCKGISRHVTGKLKFFPELCTMIEYSY